MAKRRPAKLLILLGYFLGVGVAIENRSQVGVASAGFVGLLALLALLTRGGRPLRGAGGWRP